MKALVSQKHQTRLQEVPRPSLQEGDLLLQVDVCGVCFSDVHKIRFQQLEKPTILGHEVAGRVVEVGSDVRKFKVGDRVAVAHHVPCLRCHYCLHGNISMCPQFKKTRLDPGGFAEFVRVPAMHVESVAFPIPAGLTEKEASFMEPLGCCVRAVKRAGIQRSDVVVLVGLGSIGLLLFQLIRHAGATCIGIDLDPKRRLLAQELGLTAAFAGSEPGFPEYLSNATEGRGADGVLLTAGNPALVATALTWLREGGTCTIFASLHPDSHVRLDWNQLYYRELNIVSSYSASPGDLSEALELLGNGVIRVAKLTGDTFPLERFADALAAIESRSILKAIITPHD
ncbi:MAG: alcohol dehydrogenase catalytic domain-containing protein [Verrucomicrobiota bacterium]